MVSHYALQGVQQQFLLQPDFADWLLFVLDKC